MEIGVRVVFNFRTVFDAVRYQANHRLNIEVVRVSGQHMFRTLITKVIDDYAIDAIIDVGANEGGSVFKCEA